MLHRLSGLVALTVALGLAAAGVASAATVAILPGRCAYSNQHVLVGGSGYPPSVPFQATANGVLLASGTTNPNRLKDLADVQELIRFVRPPRDLPLDPSVQGKYQELWDGLEGERNA